MGLDMTHDAFHGAYSSFNRLRVAIAEAAGLPPLEEMVGYRKPYPTGIRWDAIDDKGLRPLLDHSDCDGSLPVDLLEPLADALTRLLDHPALGAERRRVEQMIAGFRRAAAAGEPIEFH